MSDIHSCSYYCTRPKCVLAQRNELRDRLMKQAEPVHTPVAWVYQNTYTEHEYLVWKKENRGRNWRPLYAAPPKAEPVAFDPAEAMRLADEYADLAADVRAAQGYPDRAVEQHRKRMDEARASLEAYLSRQAEPGPCDHCSSPLFAGVRCRVCGRKAEQIDEALKGGGK